MTQVTFPAPGPPIGPPQQSVSFVQMSPTTRHPCATWQMCPPVLVGTQSRLQQPVPPVHAWPSSEHSPAPVVLTTMHVPAVIPAAIVQRLVQQSAGLKQMSPSDAQVAPEDAQRPPWQLSEQQMPPAVHVLPKVVQPPDVMAAHEPFAQLLEQQSEAVAQFRPSGVQRVVPHFPLAHTFVQHSVGCVQADPLPLQAGLATPQIFDTGSQTPAQHPAPLAQV
jgi:hypothetical protein